MDLQKLVSLENKFKGTIFINQKSSFSKNGKMLNKMFNFQKDVKLEVISHGGNQG